jgi:DNA-binding MarR family transcriptional regulator
MRKRDETTRTYRRVFNTKDGKKVLAHMLTELQFFSEIDTNDVKSLVEQNYAKHLLSLLGVYQAENVERVVETFLVFPFEEVE